jgi:hypothetical protein
MPDFTVMPRPSTKFMVSVGGNFATDRHRCPACEASEEFIHAQSRRVHSQLVDARCAICGTSCHFNKKFIWRATGEKKEKRRRPDFNPMKRSILGKHEARVTFNNFLN